MGILYIVPTPIGNLQDITLRAIEVLNSVDLIICEDTRVTGGLLHHLGIKKDMAVLNDNNEENKIYEVIDKLTNGLNIALVSDSGTPLISDPGFKLIRTALQKNIQIIPLPGANAITTALCASGLPTDKFLFLGFPPDSLERKKKFFLGVKNTFYENPESNLNPTIIFYESPHKLLRCLEALASVFGDIEIVIAREMTKMYEEFLTGTASYMIQHFTKTQPKGELVVMFHL
ncbi:MAG TPA: 16S rRNA (cytidine(1402)-2'-O)-methyltransferase [Candidatus Levybacteria bacterium]|nr:16S rRNA (cytidine(1402)-2'-O)-methyltransferase [Candidatus Levybacteria bacterium]